MGASNAMAAYAKYAGTVPPLSMTLLVFMALVSIDDDVDPWYGQGHAALARMALGRGRHAVVEESDLKAVERAITPLRKVGAITTDRVASVRRNGPHTARYRLHLKMEAVCTDSRPTNSGGLPVENHPDPVQEESQTVENTSQKPVHDPLTPPEFRPDAPRIPWDRGTTRNQEAKEETFVRPSRLRAPDDDQDPDLSPSATPPPTPERAAAPKTGTALDALTAGLGFCAPCYANGQTTIATNPQTGNTCTYHALSTRTLRWQELNTDQRKIIIPKTA